MITQNLQKQINEALKEGNELKVSTLRMLSSALHNVKIDKRGDLSEEDEIKVVQKEIKQRKDTIEALEAARGKGSSSDANSLEDKIEKEKKELKILESYLPKQMSNEDLMKKIEEVIEKTGADSLSDMGKVIGQVMGEVGQKAEGSRVSQIVKEKLS